MGFSFGLGGSLSYEKAETILLVAIDFGSAFRDFAVHSRKVALVSLTARDFSLNPDTSKEYRLQKDWACKSIKSNDKKRDQDERDC
jgi:hypothetical protein